MSRVKRNVEYKATFKVGHMADDAELTGCTHDLRTDAFRRRYFVEELCRALDGAVPGMMVQVDLIVGKVYVYDEGEDVRKR